MNTVHGRRMSGPEKKHGMSEEAPTIIGIAALAIDCTDPSGLAHWWRRLQRSDTPSMTGRWSVAPLYLGHRRGRS